MMTGLLWICRHRVARSLMPGLLVLVAGSSLQAGSVSDVVKLRRAITALQDEHGSAYAGAAGFLGRLEALGGRSDLDSQEWRGELERLRREALTANPDLKGRLLFVRRKAKNPIKDLAIPAPHASNSGFRRDGYDNEMVVASLDDLKAEPKGLFRPKDGGYVGEIELHWDAERILFTRSDEKNWKLWEMGLDGTGLRQVSRTDDDIDCFDGCYLADDDIVFGSTASFQSVPCHHGKMPPSLLSRMAPDGSRMRQLCFDQDMNANPVLLPNGQIMFSRWDYTGINHIFMRQLMVMNPDGTGQKAVYGSNSWFPNSLFFFTPLPGDPSRVVSILSGYHGVPRMGWLVVMNPAEGWRDEAGIEVRISGRGSPIKPVIKDNAMGADRPLFLHPYPVSDEVFLVAGLEKGAKNWKIYLADVFDNLVPLFEDPGYSLIEPVMVRSRKRPPLVAERVDLKRNDAEVYLQDIHAGPGLKGVPRGTVKKLRVLAYHFGYRGLAGPDKIGYGGPWDAMRILGTTPIEADGSAYFRIPANTPVAFQPIDGENKALQLMRSWTTAMPGERVSCAGCHEGPAEVSTVVPTLAMKRPALDLEPWHGPARGFDFAREVQPVLSRRCSGCHDGERAAPDLRPEEQVAERQTWPIGYPERLEPEMSKATKGRLTYTPAYDALIHYIRRVGIEDDVSMLEAGEYHADTSPLIQLLRKGHHGVELDQEEWDRLVTWIDLNGPCHGTWGDVFAIPNKAHERRLDSWKKYGGPKDDPEVIPEIDAGPVAFVKPKPLPVGRSPALAGWPLGVAEARKLQEAGGPAKVAVDLGGGLRLALVRLPAGGFVMGSADGEPDEQPQLVRRVDSAFWIGACEVSNAQFGRFDPEQDPKYYARRLPRPDGQGTPLNEPKQPAVRVSWRQAMEFCRWLSAETGLEFTLPSESQWEYACRAGSDAAFSFGAVDADFSKWANFADKSFGRGVMKPLKVHPDSTSQWSGGVPHLVMDGAGLADTRFKDGFSVTAPAGRFQPNAWGLHDMHGNAAEWTRTVYQNWLTAGEPEEASADGRTRRVVRGGSFFDPPRRSRSASRLGYPEWQRVFNVGFRVICTSPDEAVRAKGR